MLFIHFHTLFICFHTHSNDSTMLLYAFHTLFIRFSYAFHTLFIRFHMLSYAFIRFYMLLYAFICMLRSLNLLICCIMSSLEQQQEILHLCLTGFTLRKPVKKYYLECLLFQGKASFLVWQVPIKVFHSSRHRILTCRDALLSFLVQATSQEL